MAKTHATIKLGDVEVQRIGLGTNRITDTDTAKSVLLRAAEASPFFIDTADIYQNGESESMIGKTLAPYPAGIIVGTKGGAVRGSDPDDNSEKHMRATLEASLRRLKTETIYLYQLHRIDARIPIEKTMELFKQFQSEGKIHHIGLSNATVDDIKRARSVTKVASVQNQYNLSYREDDEVVDYCEANDIAFLPWFPLNKGSLAAQNMLEEIAKRHSATPLQIALAWLLKRSPAILPIPGTLSVAHLEENLAALDIDLTQEDFNALAKSD